jgi:hypothetical protein
VPYDGDYWAKYQRYRGTPTAVALNAARVALTLRHCPSGSLLDVGIGSGEFIEAHPGRVFGHDVNPHAREWLDARGLWRDPYRSWPEGCAGVTLWDVLEHLPEPDELLGVLPAGAFAFVSLPVAAECTPGFLRKWKHFRMNEHYHYWSSAGLVRWMDARGYRMLECNDDECGAGRSDIRSFAFRKHPSWR